MRIKTHFPQVAIILLSLSFVLFFSFPLAAKSTLRVGVPSSLPPFSFIDIEDGGLRGFCIDLALLLGREMGVGIKFISMGPAELRKALRDGRVDLISCAASGKGEDPAFSVIETDVIVERQYFVNNYCLTVTCHKDLPGHTIAVVADSEHLDVDLNRHDISFVNVSSPIEALRALESGKAEVYIAYSDLTAQYLIQKNRLQNIKKVGVPIESLPFSVLVRKDNADLLKELSLAFGKILEKKEYERIHSKWLGRGVSYVLWENYIKAFLVALGLVASGLFILVSWNLLLKRRVSRVTHDLAVSEKKYRDLIEFSPDMIFLVSPEGNINLANIMALRKLDLSENKATSLKLQDLVLPESRAAMEAFVDAVFREGFAQGEFVINSSNGMGINVEVIAAVVSGTGGSSSMACCVSRDITQRRQLEEELIQSERLVTMGQMAAGIAHEINNPLGIILAHTQDALHGGLESEEIYGSLQSIERNALRAGRIIDNLLSFTRPRAFQRTSVDLAQLIDESLYILKGHIKKKRIKIREELPDSPLILQGDENQIQQLLINLILNSIEAIEGHGTITIRARLQDGNGGNSPGILLEVEDTGNGIPEEELPRIFDPFFTSRKKKGFGLGLFITKTIVDKHGGAVYASSKEGEGTVMTVELPSDGRPPVTG